MNKILLILFCVLFTNLYSQTATAPAAGNGTEGNPYQIASLANLYWIAATDAVVPSPNSATRWASTTYYIQTADIDASATSGWFSDAGFPPIGTLFSRFYGKYDGNGYNISNLHINQPSNNYIALFGFCEGANLKNINLENATITGAENVAGLVGYASSSTAIDNCSSNASVTGTSKVGALVGNGNGNGLTITNSHSSGIVNGTAGIYAGGLAGHLYGGPLTVTNCYSTAIVNGGSQGAGGLVGRCDVTTITSSYSTGTVSGTGNYYGGLVGWMSSNSVVNNSYSTGTVSGTGNFYGGMVGDLDGTVTNSYSVGNIIGGAYLGGFSGRNVNSSTINNCYSIGSVNASSNAVGGFSGSNEGSSTINNCYSIGSVSGHGGYVGGLLGYSSSTANSSFWNKETSGKTSSAAGLGKTTPEMNTQTTFTNAPANWDFIVETDNGTNDYWEMNSGFNKGYPILSWQSVEVAGITTTPNIVSSSNIGFTALSGSVSLSFTEMKSIPINLPGEAVTINKYWEISDVTNGNVKLRLYYLPALTTSFTGTPKIMHYNGSAWEVLPTEPEEIVGLMRYVETTNYYSSFSPVTIGDDDSPLPVELTTFTAKLANNKVNLTWQTATEVNNYGFQVERSLSKNQNEAGWVGIGFVNGNGNSNSPKSYSFIDASAPVRAGKVYYRLKQIDTDGQFEYSDVIEVSTSLPTVFKLEQNYPNPFNPSTEIRYQVPTASHVTLTVYDMLGNKITELVNEVKEAGRYQINFTAAGLTSGLYFYRFEAGNFIQLRKMMVLK